MSTPVKRDTFRPVPLWSQSQAAKAADVSKAGFSSASSIISAGGPSTLEKATESKASSPINKNPSEPKASASQSQKTQAASEVEKNPAVEKRRPLYDAKVGDPLPWEALLGFV